MGKFVVQDFYFKKAKKEHYLARSVYKLDEIDQRFQVINRNDYVLDLGYHPGSWVQYAQEKIGPQGRVIGLDIRPVNKSLLVHKNVSLFEKDAFTLESLEEIGVPKQFDVVLSDMAPNTCGVKDVDQARSLNLIEKVFESLPTFLKPDGHMVIKVFDSHDAQVYLKANKNIFKEFHFLKPKSTRSCSKEFFAIGKCYLPPVKA